MQSTTTTHSYSQSQASSYRMDPVCCCLTLPLTCPAVPYQANAELENLRREHSVMRWQQDQQLSELQLVLASYRPQTVLNSGNMSSGRQSVQNLGDTCAGRCFFVGWAVDRQV